MEICRRHTVYVLVLVGFVLMISGCGTMRVDRWGEHPDLLDRSTTVNKIALATPDLKIYQLSAGGVRELMDEWCETGSRLFSTMVTEQLSQKSVAMKPLETDKEVERELNEVYALYYAIVISINWHTMMGSPDYFPHKREDFKYSVGSLEKILKKSKADGLFIITGSDEISSGGRKALMAVGNVLSIIPGMNVGPAKGYTAVTMALFDKSGAMLWYNQLGNSGQVDLREPGDVQLVSKHLLRSFPRVGK